MSTQYPILQSLTYDGVDLLDLLTNGWEFSISQGIIEPSDVRGVDVVIPYLDGQIPRPRRVHARKVVLSGHVMGRGSTQDLRRADYRALIRSLRITFDTARQPADLVALMEDDWTASLSARPLNVIPVEFVASEYCEYNVELLSVDPDWTLTAPGS